MGSLVQSQTPDVSLLQDNVNSCYLLEVVLRGLEQLVAVLHPSLALSHVHAEPHVVQPGRDAVTVPARKRRVEITAKKGMLKTSSCSA